ncbi:MAG: branched-chain amino acid aminotransferase [Arcanobacterium sp.]|nr:branched-chain amino acid aminotransferase [Arcanobacterium sp.]
MSRTPTELEQIAAQSFPTAAELAGTFKVQPHSTLRTDAEVAQQMQSLGFGKDFTDYMAHATWTPETGWSELRVEPYGPITLDPGTSVLHYGQEVFEGLKAYRHPDGSVWTFRPAYNAARLNKSNIRLGIPELPIETFLASIVDLVRADERWVPSEAGASLYLRPFIFASESFLGVRAATRYEYLVIASPAGPYFKGGAKPIELWVEREYHRAGPGGMGDVKTGGNYAASLYPKLRAGKQGFDECLFLDAATNTNLDELGGMNVFVVMRDGSVKTPALNGNILPGTTRSSILTFLEAEGIPVSETTIPLKELIADIESGEVTEMFACGTAAVVTAIGRLASEDFDVRLEAGPVTKQIHDELTSIQLGTREDRFNWLYRLSD